MYSDQIMSKLKAQIESSKRIIGVAPGNGMIASYAVKGNADLILALSSSRFRQMGKSSLAGLLPFANGNNLVMQFGSKEILPIIDDVPGIFGLFASDPTINLHDYIEDILYSGFSGIINYPSIGLLDGKYREALEEANLGYQREVDAIRIARNKGIFTIAFVFDVIQAKQMAEIEPHVICVNLGLTKGGELGAKKVMSLEESVKLANEIFMSIDVGSQKPIKMIYGGSVTTPIDLQYIYDNTDAEGYIGGSSFERIPSEQFITDRIIEFKHTGYYKKDKLMKKMLDGVHKYYSNVDFVKEYVAENYMNEIFLHELASVAHVSRTYLSAQFNKEVGCTFPEYLANYRIGKACEMMKQEKDLPLLEIAHLVGYNDYGHFSRTFKKKKGLPPSQFRKQYKDL